jgi:hypothetical protein
MKKHLFMFVLLPVMVSCGNNESSPQDEPSDDKQFTLVFDRARFDREKQLWADMEMYNYSFGLSLGSNAGGEAATVIVRNGTLCYIRPIRWNSIEYRHEEKELYLPYMYFAQCKFKELYRTIPEIHTYIERVIESYASKSGTLTVKVKYDSTLHYPQHFEYSWADPDGNTAPGSGGVITMGISNLTRDPVVPEETSFTFNRETFTEGRQEWEAQNNRDYTFYIMVMYTSGDKGRDADYWSGKNPDYWSGEIVVRDGKVHELIPSYGVIAQPGEMVQAWIAPITGIYAKVAEEAEKYDGEPGVYIDVDDVDNGRWRDIKIYYLRLPGSPIENCAYYVGITYEYGLL